MENAVKNVENKAETAVKQAPKARKTTPKTAPKTTGATKGKATSKTKKEPVKRAKRVRRSGLEERAIIREKVKDWSSKEVRETQARINEKTKALNFKMDPRNADLLDKFVDSNGLGKALTIDLAVFRFVEDVENKGVAFPYQALAQVDVQEDENVSFTVSETTKNRLDSFCKTNGQQSQLVVNIALQSFFDECRNVMK